MFQYLKFRGAVYRLVTAAKTIMYHGTATGHDGEILRSILKRGLVPSPPHRPYDEVDRLYESYPGVYLTQNISLAKSHAGGAESVFGGNEIIVAVQIETKSPSVRIDEDCMEAQDFWLAGYLRLYHDDEKIKELWAEPTRQREYIYRVSIQKLKDLHDQYGIKLTGVQRKLVWPSLMELVKTNTELMLAYGDAEDLDPYAEGTAAHPLTLEVNKKNQLYRSAMEKFLRLLHNATKQAADSVRITEPITYRGANKIVSIVQINPLTIVYDHDSVTTQSIMEWL